MRRWQVTVAVLLSFYLFVYGAIAEEKPIGLCYEGKIFRVAGTLEKGVALADLKELLKILRAEVIAKEEKTITLLVEGKKEVKIDYFSKGSDEIYIPLRQLGQKLYKQVYWEGKTRTVIWAEQYGAALFKSDYDMVTALLAEDWMFAESKEALYSYFAPLLGGELLVQVTENCWEFVSQPTDWHERYYLKELQPLAAGANWRALRAEITAKGIDEEDSTGYGLFIFTRQPGGDWKITAMEYFWP